MDEQAFALLIEPYRRALHLHCYRMLGSLHDADDALQETMLRAWKGADRYEPRAQLGAWLHAIATNVCLTALARSRARPAETTEDLEHLQPYPDRLLEDLVVRETVELAFITASSVSSATRPSMSTASHAAMNRFTSTRSGSRGAETCLRAPFRPRRARWRALVTAPTESSSASAASLADQPRTSRRIRTARCFGGRS